MLLGDCKKNHNIAIFQPERWQEIFRTRTAKAESLRLSVDFVAELLSGIHKESIRQQAEQMYEEQPQM